MTGTTQRGPVLFAYDGSEHAKAAIEQAGRELRNGRRAIVLTVWEPVASIAVPGGLGFVPPPGSDADMGEAERVAQEGVGLVRATGFDAEPLVAQGDPVWEAIARAADVHDAAIVVMGSHARTRMALVLLGSVAAAAVRHSQRPVLIAHASPGRREAQT